MHNSIVNSNLVTVTVKQVAYYCSLMIKLRLGTDFKSMRIYFLLRFQSIIINCTIRLSESMFRTLLNYVYVTVAIHTNLRKMLFDAILFKVIFFLEVLLKIRARFSIIERE